MIFSSTQGQLVGARQSTENLRQKLARIQNSFQEQWSKTFFFPIFCWVLLHSTLTNCPWVSKDLTVQRTEENVMMINLFNVQLSAGDKVT